MPDIKGIVGEKLGMTQIFVETRAVPVTVIKAGPCVVTQVRTEENDGYAAVQLAYGTVRPRDVSKPAQGHFDKAGVTLTTGRLATQIVPFTPRFDVTQASPGLSAGSTMLVNPPA